MEEHTIDTGIETIESVAPVKAKRERKVKPVVEVVKDGFFAVLTIGARVYEIDLSQRSASFRNSVESIEDFRLVNSDFIPNLKVVLGAIESKAKAEKLSIKNADTIAFVRYNGGVKNKEVISRVDFLRGLVALEKCFVVQPIKPLKGRAGAIKRGSDKPAGF